MVIKRIIIEALPTLMLASSITVIAGFFLNSALSIGEVIGVLIITPAILGTGGDIGTSFGARITTSLHSGLIEPRFRRFRLVFVNFIALFICGLIVSVIIGFAAFSISELMGGNMGLVQFLILSLGAGSIEYIIILFLSLCISFISFRRGLDPDNLVAPLITTISDLIGISAIFLILSITT
ncbi:MAG: magnesium transporter [Promethearchaeota archaeon]